MGGTQAWQELKIISKTIFLNNRNNYPFLCNQYCLFETGTITKTLILRIEAQGAKEYLRLWRSHTSAADLAAQQLSDSIEGFETVISLLHSSEKLIYLRNSAKHTLSSNML